MLQKVKTKRLIAALRQRGGLVDSTGFIDAYSGFVCDCLAGKESIDAGPYFDWIVEKLRIDGHYGPLSSVAHIPDRLAADRELIADIAANGIREPVRLMPDADGLEIDGWHRAVIADVLGFKEVEYEAREGFAWPKEAAA